MSQQPSNTNHQPPELRMLHCDADFSLGVLATCVLTVWRRSVGAAAVFPVLRTVQEMRAQQPQARLVLLSFVEPDCAMPGSPDLARAWADMLKRHQAAIAGTAVVYNRDGFWSAAMRSQVMAINTESKAGIPHFVTPSIEAACGWLAALLDSAPPVSTTVDAVERLRAARVALAHG